MEDGVTIAVDVIPPSELLQAREDLTTPNRSPVSSFLLHKLLDPVASCCIAFSRRRNSEKFASYYLRFAVEIFPCDVFPPRVRRPQIQVGRSFVRWTARVKVAAVEVDPIPPLIPRRDETEHRTLLPVLLLYRREEGRRPGLARCRCGGSLAGSLLGAQEMVMRGCQVRKIPPLSSSSNTLHGWGSQGKKYPTTAIQLGGNVGREGDRPAGADSDSKYEPKGEGERDKFLVREFRPPWGKLRQVYNTVRRGIEIYVEYHE